MVERLFASNNANADIMVVPQQEGATEDDHYFGSIGDATMKHVHSLNGFGRQLWEEIIHTPSGDLFRMVPSWYYNDKDPNNLRGKDLDKYLDKLKNKVSSNTIDILEEAIENEKERRLNEEQEIIGHPDDALNQELIPFDEWENFPNQWNKIEIPATPCDIALYVGNTTQQFYDSFPEGHPDANVINQFLVILNKRQEDELDENFMEWLEKQLDTKRICPYVKAWLKWLIKHIAKDEDRAEEYIETALHGIDKAWAIEYKNISAKKSICHPVTSLLLEKEKEWEDLTKKGEPVYGKIKNFGKTLFKEYRKQMTGYHWERYRRIRDKYAPKIVFKNIDLNRCSVQELKDKLRLNQNSAEKIWFMRPFSSLEEIHSKGLVTGKSFAENDIMDNIIAFIEKHIKIAKENSDIGRINDIQKILNKMQKDKCGNLHENQWDMIWKYYRILRLSK